MIVLEGSYFPLTDFLSTYKAFLTRTFFSSALSFIFRFSLKDLSKAILIGIFACPHRILFKVSRSYSTWFVLCIAMVLWLKEAVNIRFELSEISVKGITMSLRFPCWIFTGLVSSFWGVWSTKACPSCTCTLGYFYSELHIVCRRMSVYSVRTYIQRVPTWVVNVILWIYLLVHWPLNLLHESSPVTCYLKDHMHRFSLLLFQETVMILLHLSDDALEWWK